MILKSLGLFLFGIILGWFMKPADVGIDSDAVSEENLLHHERAKWRQGIH